MLRVSQIDIMDTLSEYMNDQLLSGRTRLELTKASYLVSSFFCSACPADRSNFLRRIVLLIYRYFFKHVNPGASLGGFYRMASTFMGPRLQTQSRAVGVVIALASTWALHRKTTPGWMTCTYFLRWKTCTLFLISVGESCCVLLHLVFTWSNHVLVHSAGFQNWHR
jgi:hypothetical protein